tara:strand:+ start:1667 stop:1780 length:114 start_codon:yes stop_codon:yes gene_type:complete
MEHGEALVFSYWWWLYLTKEERLSKLRNHTKEKNDKK